jgi:hypothetical protein
LWVPPGATITATADLMACTGEVPAEPTVNLFCVERFTGAELEGKYYYTVSFWRPGALEGDWTESDRFNVVDPRLGRPLARAP